ncbi:patatin-like protein 2 isoform X2 [Gossypium australe]|uniref:Patatin n=1 Tax=Gossypium australe TaxID=47621 RepID=A0A5B6WUE8_9ROSI|nr:patatin-like protein 2 isoform X2 [Gossypium australe]
MLTAPHLNEGHRPLFAAKDINGFYLQHCPKIFLPDGSLFAPVTNLVKSLTGPKYDGEYLHNIVREKLGKTRLDQTLTKVVIPTFDIKQLQPRIFSSYEVQYNPFQNALLCDICIRTSAAPTYLPAHQFEIKNSTGEVKEFHLIDGGTLVAMSEVAKEINRESTYPELYVQACDISPHAIALVKSHAEFKEDWVNAFLCDVTVDNLLERINPFSIDVITLIFILSAVSPHKMPSILQNIKRVLKPDGYVLLRDYAIGDFAQATKLREQVAKQQQAVLRHLGHFSNEDVTVDEADLQCHQKLQDLYSSTKATKHLQRNIVRGIEARKLADDCCKYGVENQNTGSSLAKVAVHFGNSHKSIEDERETLLGILCEQVSEPLRALITGAPLEDARHLTHRYDRFRQ